MTSKGIILILSQHPLIGARTIRKLKNNLDLKKLSDLSRVELVRLGVSEKIALAIKESFEKYNEKEIIRKNNLLGIKTVFREDKDYPLLLDDLPDAPELIYYLGNLDPLRNMCVSIVGTRKASSYGLEVTRRIVGTLCKAGATIVSGLALGIDGQAHGATLENKGSTVAVLANGLDTIYPSSHINLGREIINSGGALISEYPAGTPSYPSQFPVRNRIIAGLSKATIVVEASKKSGSLLTAQAALEYNREVLAVPHNWFSRGGEGPNQLLRMGAGLIAEENDLYETLGIEKQENSVKIYQSLTPKEEVIMKIIGSDNLHLDEIILQSGQEAAKINATITLMEMKKIIKPIGGNRYMRYN